MQATSSIKRMAAAAALMVMGSALAQNFREGSEWAPSAGGGIPPGAARGGHEANGEPLYICSAHYENGQHPGKIRPAFGGCNISWGGREITIPQYEVMMREDRYTWIPAEGGGVPPGAVPGGFENGAFLYVCHAEHEGSMQPGKIRPEFGGCDIPYGGHEITKHRYGVLVRVR
jgi:hypothetical protein